MRENERRGSKMPIQELGREKGEREAEDIDGRICALGKLWYSL